MRVTFFAITVFALSGCSTVSSLGDAWTWDPATQQRPVRLVLSAPELASLTNEVAGLQIQRNEIRSRISGEPDIRNRLDLYEELHGVGRRLSPLERRLAMAAPAR
ncbi:MAG: hypothetical protein HYX47_18215 [Burkholderiales bacterium]|nr:hypothetical protein [Burkholderiales bacterium]